MIARIDISVQNGLRGVEAALRRELSRAVRRAALDLEREAKMRAPVDTGYLRASIYAVTHQGSGATSARAAAAKTQPQKTRARRFVDRLFETDDFTAYVAIGADYAIYVEARNPFFAPSARLVERRFRRNVEQALGRMQ